MKCRKDVRKLIAEYNSASATEKPNTTLIKLRNAIKALKSEPSRIIPAQVSRYDDYVYIHQQSMVGHPNTDPGPHAAHKGPMFFPWHREYLRQFELDLQAVSGDSNLTLPYWNWTKDQGAADPGFPFIDAFLGPDGTEPTDKVMSSEFAQTNGWNLNVTDPGSSDVDGALRRDFGQGFPGFDPPLPSAANVQNCLAITTYDSSPWNMTATGSGSFRNTTEGWVGPGAIHNAVHVWIGGSMNPSTSPNDPIFFLHHNNIDRMWAVWMQKHPGIDHYRPLDGEPTPTGAHHFVRLHERMTDLEAYFGGTVTPAGLLNHKAIVWYDSDLPEITNETGSSMSFGGVPENLTSYKAVKFKIKTGRQVRFRITGAPSGNFGLANGITEFRVDPDDSQEFVYAYVFVQFHSIGGLGQTSAVDIEAYLIDEEGYYAATEGGEYSRGTYHVDMSADVIPREDNAVVLILDRSGSMSTAAGGGSTRSTLLKNAVNVFHTLMLPSDEIGIVSFDDVTETLLTITPQSAVNINTIINGGGLEPRGATGIGKGILDGSTLLATATHTNKSMVVLTDGNENVHPYVNELPSGTISNRTYAIGFGLQGQVSEAVLNQITQNTNGDLIITGNMTSSDQQFHLTKYFVQLLAGITNSNIILDPQAELLWNAKHSISFVVADTDVSIDLIALCDLPLLLDFSLETPSGKIINSYSTSTEPNVKYVEGGQALCFRLMLPALPADASGSHAGEWKAHLKIIDKKRIEELVKKERISWNQIAGKIKESLPYSFMASTYSNLQLQASVIQKSFEPGSDVKLVATLHEYDVPFAGTASLWVEIDQPNKVSTVVTLNRTLPGQYNAPYTTPLPGIYRFRFRAEGYTSAGYIFKREKTLSNSIFDMSRNKPPDEPVVRRPQETEKWWCEFFMCLVSDKVLTSRAIKTLSELGIDIENLKECVVKYCKSQLDWKTKDVAPASEQLTSILQVPEVKKTLDIIARQRISLPNIGFKDAATATPLVPKKVEMVHDKKMIPVMPYVPPEIVREAITKEKKKRVGKKQKK